MPSCSNSRPYSWPYDAKLTPQNTVFLVIDMQVGLNSTGLTQKSSISAFVGHVITGEEFKILGEIKGLKFFDFYERRLISVAMEGMLIRWVMTSVSPKVQLNQFVRS